MAELLRRDLRRASAGGAGRLRLMLTVSAFQSPREGATGGRWGEAETRRRVPLEGVRSAPVAEPSVGADGGWHSAGELAQPRPASDPAAMAAQHSTGSALKSTLYWNHLQTKIIRQMECRNFARNKKLKPDTNKILVEKINETKTQHLNSLKNPTLVHPKNVIKLGTPPQSQF